MAEDDEAASELETGPEPVAPEWLERRRASAGQQDDHSDPNTSWLLHEAAGRDLAGDAATAPSRRAARGASHRAVREVVETGLLAILVFLCIRASFQNFRVEGTSMYPTLRDGQLMVVNELAFARVDVGRLSFLPFVDGHGKHDVFHGPQRGDIIVLKDPEDTRVDLVKRIIGLPGETIAIHDGQVYIDGQLLEEPYIVRAWHGERADEAIPPGYYFVMGDNRDNSKDSRYPSIGLIPRALIIGRATLSYWPLGQFGLAPNGGAHLEAAAP